MLHSIFLITSKMRSLSRRLYEKSIMCARSDVYLYAKYFRPFLLKMRKFFRSYPLMFEFLVDSFCDLATLVVLVK